MEYYCPNCGDEMVHWNQEIYECESCEIMIDVESQEGDVSC